MDEPQLAALARIAFFRFHHRRVDYCYINSDADFTAGLPVDHPRNIDAFIFLEHKKLLETSAVICDQ